MAENKGARPILPSAEELLRAVTIYLRHAYPSDRVRAPDSLLPENGFDPAAYLMSEKAQRDPSSAPLDNVRSFSLRLGNWQYPHMKLRLSRPPNDDVFVFSVDAHDAFLFAPGGGGDAVALEELKKNNSLISSAIMNSWDADGLLTERNYLRRRIHQTRRLKTTRP